MQTDPNAIVYEIKIIMKADGSRSIESVDGNGQGMNLLAVRDAVNWASQKIQDQVMLTMINAALIERQRQDKGVIIPKLV